MATSTQGMKEAAIKIMEAVKSIYPLLAEVSKQTDFEITITGDKKGIGMEFSLDWDPTADPEPQDGKQYRNPIVAEDMPEGMRIDECEKELIERAISISNGNYKEAAARLGFSERNFYRKCKQYGLKR